MVEKIIRDLLLLFSTIDPIGTMALFVALTGQLSAAERNKVARKATIFAAAILVGSIAIGQIILKGMGIRLLSLQVAGSIILFLFGLQMIFTEPAKLSAVPEAGHDLAVFPLAVPSIAGPGSIMAVILLTDNEVHSVFEQGLTAALLLIILALTYGLMRLGDLVLWIIGKNGTAILIRIMGMILSALSVELFMSALDFGPWKGK